MMVKTFGSIFDYVYLWAVKHSLDLLLVGSNEPFKFNADKILERVHTLNTGKFPLIFVLSKNPLQIKEFLLNNSNIPLNTDDRPLLEFHAAKNLLTGVF